MDLKEYYKYLKNNCTKCNGKGIILLKNNMYKNCICTKKYIKDAVYIKNGLPTFYLKEDIKVNDILRNNMIDLFNDLKDNFNKKILNNNYLFIKKNNNCGNVLQFIVLLLLNVNFKNFKMISIERLFDMFITDKIKLNDYINTELLIIYNFGKEFKKVNVNESYNLKKLFSILEERIFNLKGNILISDKTIDSISKKYNEEIKNFFDEYFNIIPLSIKTKKKDLLKSKNNIKFTEYKKQTTKKKLHSLIDEE